MSHDAVAEALRMALREREERARSEGERGLGVFRIVCGSICAVVCVLFLVVNTVMLAKFGFRMGMDELEQWGQAVIAGTVPWVIALFPFILISTWVPARVVDDRRGRVRRKRGRPSFATVSAIALYLVFIAVNFVGGIGVMSVARQNVAGKAQDAVSETKRLNDTRDRYLKQLDGITRYRPVAEVESLISRHQQHSFWRLTAQCDKSQPDKITSRAQRNYCAEHDLLLAERERGKRGGEIEERIAGLDLQLADPTRTQFIAADAQAAALSALTSFDEARVRFLLPLMWPVLLEIGSMMLGYFALRLFRISHMSLIDMPTGAQMAPVGRQLSYGPGPGGAHAGSSRPGGDRQDEPIPLTAYSVAVSEDPIQQRAVFDEFWAKRVRRVESGQVPEATFYTHYQALCAQRMVGPLDIEAFRRLSAPHLRNGVVEMAGVRWWCHLVPTDA